MFEIVLYTMTTIFIGMTSFILYDEIKLIKNNNDRSNM